MSEPDWIDHDGSDECPVPHGHDVELLFLDGWTNRDKEPENWRWGKMTRPSTQIIAYRDWTVFNHQQEKHKWKSPEGGVPPVGTVCEVTCNEFHGVWYKIKITAVTDEYVVGHIRDDRERAFRLKTDGVRFRTIKSPEDSHFKTKGMTFGQAIEAAKIGYRIARAGWNGKGMWVIYNPGSDGEVIDIEPGSVYEPYGISRVEILPHFDMYTVNAEGRRAMLPGWLASQTDMDSDDWEVVLVVDMTFDS